MLKTI
jgi:hypothetical protein